MYSTCPHCTQLPPASKVPFIHQTLRATGMGGAGKTRHKVATTRAIAILYKLRPPGGLCGLAWLAPGRGRGLQNLGMAKLPFLHLFCTPHPARAFASSQSSQIYRFRLGIAHPFKPFKRPVHCALLSQKEVGRELCLFPPFLHAECPRTPLGCEQRHANTADLPSQVAISRSMPPRGVQEPPPTLCPISRGSLGPTHVKAVAQPFCTTNTHRNRQIAGRVR